MAGYHDRIDRVLAEAHGGVVAAAAREAVLCWVDAVADWNQRVDLTAARNDDELVDLLLADAATLASWLPQRGTQRLVDVGTGAGAPGLPLALLRGDLAVTLVEPMQKRATLLRMVLGRVAAAAGAAPAARVLQERGERLRERYGVALSRATLPPPQWLALGARLAPAGEVIVLLAREPAPELAGWEQEARKDYRWPLTGAERSLVRYRPRAAPSRRTARR